MYNKKLKAKSSNFKNIRKSFTLIEVVVVMGVMGMIMGGLLVSLRQIIDGETLLKKMQGVEEETRFIMDAFAQDAEYSELYCRDSESDPRCYKPSKDEGDIFAYNIKFLLAEKRSEIESEGSLESEYASYSGDKINYFLKRTLTEQTDPKTPGVAATLNNTPLKSKPVFRIRMISSRDGAENFFITLSLVYRVVNKDQVIYLPVQTSVMSRTFVF